MILVHAFVPWDFYFSHRLDLLKKEVADLLPRWLDAWHELEALNSLANCLVESECGFISVDVMRGVRSLQNREP